MILFSRNIVAVALTALFVLEVIDAGPKRLTAHAEADEDDLSKRSPTFYQPIGGVHQGGWYRRAYYVPDSAIGYQNGGGFPGGPGGGMFGPGFGMFGPGGPGMFGGGNFFPGMGGMPNFPGGGYPG